MLREIREAERGRIARDLHNVVLQYLTYALRALLIRDLRAANPHAQELVLGSTGDRAEIVRAVGGCGRPTQVLGDGGGG